MPDLACRTLGIERTGVVGRRVCIANARRGEIVQTNGGAGTKQLQVTPKFRKGHLEKTRRGLRGNEEPVPSHVSRFENENTLVT